MATTYLSPPNALMMSGESGNTIAIHGKKKLGVFPDWYWVEKYITTSGRGKWGKLEIETKGSMLVRWRVPFDREPMGGGLGSMWMTVNVPDVYTVQRASYETEEDQFFAKIDICKSAFGVEFKITDKKDAAIAERPAPEEGNPCDRVIPKYYVVLCPLDEIKDSRAHSKLVAEYGNGSYAIALALKINVEDRFFSKDGGLYDALLYYNTFGYKADYAVQYMGYAAYKMDGTGPYPLDIGSVTVEMGCTYHTVIDFPPMTTRIPMSAKRTIGFDKNSKKYETEWGWESKLGVFEKLNGPNGGSPVIKTNSEG